MKLSFINDWRYLFSKNAIGGRFASFTVFHLAWMHGLDQPDLKLDGLSLIILGLGVRISSK